MDSRIPVKDVKQIIIEVSEWSHDLTLTNILGKLKKPSNIVVRENIDGWMDGRIKMVLDRLKHKENNECIHNVDDTLISESTNEIYKLTAIGKRKCLVEVISENGGSHEFERRISEVNKYIQYIE